MDIRNTLQQIAELNDWVYHHKYIGKFPHPGPGLTLDNHQDLIILGSELKDHGLANLARESLNIADNGVTFTVYWSERQVQNA